ncbi:uncharacterized protein LOC126839630 isoform X2 [Adelges cooleyi]|uniref:uncharacterized protein LOC126839630 isoform X2 n=1 Tax=Adelges cooleyi TaxID=133065 RepID=UPI00217FDFF8|nr:uncharacterized protein LOC126839630 isoform X2 [Adelges cooleyi]
MEKDPLVGSNPNSNYRSLVGEKAIVNTQPGDEVLSENQHTTGPGLKVWMAAVFVAGEMAGTGVLAVPWAVVNSGWIGFLLLFAFAVTAAYSGSRLGDCWAILEERYPECQASCKNPYPTIAFYAFGKKTSYLTSTCIQLTLFGAGTVYLMLVAQIVQKLLENVFPNLGFCSWLLLFSIAISPLMFLESPKDFSLVGIGALLTTSIACVLICIQIFLDGTSNAEPVEHNSHTLDQFFLSFGTILFSYGGASAFPTIQNDMFQREKFPKSVLIAFIIIMALYVPIVLGGYLVYGDKINQNIALSLSPTWLTTIANTLMATHLILGFIIIINPVSQQLELFCNVPNNFCFKRLITRFLLLSLMVLLGESIPNFGKLVALIGGSTVTMSTFVLPSLLHMKLCSQTNPLWPERQIAWHSKMYMWEIIIVGILGGIASTYAAVVAIVNMDSFTKPCYWNCWA